MFVHVPASLKPKPVSTILHHTHPYFIYEVIMKYILVEYEVVIKKISIIFSKNEVVNTAMFVYYQNASYHNETKVKVSV